VLTTQRKGNFAAIRAGTSGPGVISCDRASLLLLVAVCFLSIPVVAPAEAYDLEIAAFIDEMVEKEGFEAKYLRTVLRGFRPKKSILDAISRPAEAKPWFKYRPIFVTNARRDGGVAFWRDNAGELARAEKKYGIPAEIVVAIIGVETFYGKHKGRYRVVDALATLGFAYPKRAKFFRSELRHFLLLAREQGVNPLSLTGSYAGAMGMPQFIASSYRSYATDFDGDGFTDIWDNRSDVIGSIANYLSVHGWIVGAPIAMPTKARLSDKSQLVSEGLEADIEIQTLLAAGIEVDATPKGNPKVTFMALEQEQSVEHWIGLRNFYVITRYNHSALYAMAVFQLAQEIRAVYDPS
jgi:membrane-bound lytic murein transglycosylase B